MSERSHDGMTRAELVERIYELEWRLRKSQQETYRQKRRADLWRERATRKTAQKSTKRLEA